LKTEAEYAIRAELPGTTKNDVRVRLDAGVLTIEGERKQETKQEESKYLRVECAYGYFLRRFVLPPDAVPGGISAAHRDGILRVTIPRQAPVPDDKTIPIS
ncbi:MAG: Hsp20/alpha crystallin family protein, partial [Polyangiales bacterium]